MSRKHFRFAASQCLAIYNIELRKEVARKFILFFEQYSERFNRKLFWNACGLDNYLLEV